MIPFAILSGQLYIPERESVEIRILDLAPDGFTFRLPRQISVPEDEKVEICLHFFRYAKNVQERDYEEVILSKVSLILSEQRPFWNLFRVETENLEFREQAIRLSEAYLHYVECRLSMDDAELSQEMIGYPASRDAMFATSGEAQWKKWAGEIQNQLDETSWDWIWELSEADKKICNRMESKQARVSFGLELCGTQKVQQFLQLPIQTLWERYLRERFLIKHPLYRICPDRIVVGSAFCPILVPDVERVHQILEKAEREALKVTVVLPPVSELRWEAACDYIRKLSGKKVSLQLNDAGILNYCEEQNFPGISLEQGILMCKQKKDVRMRFWGLKQQELPYGFANLDRFGEMLYFPFYQMNTATFCTLYASVVYGDRGTQNRVAVCPEYCREWNFLYPEHLHMVGRYNSLYGLNIRTLTDGNVLKRAAESGVSQFVLNW